MKIYALKEPSAYLDVDCAEVGPIGELGYISCNICNYRIGFPKPEVRVLEWLEDSNIVCDFTWPARLFAEVFVQGRVRAALSSEPIEWIPVQWYQDPKLKRPKRPRKGSKKLVWLPYEGPPIYGLWATTWVHADLSRSSLQLVHECPACGWKAYKLEGIEEKSSRWDNVKKDLVPVHVPRSPGKGIFIHEADLKGVNVFRIYEWGRLVCTERLKNIIEQNGFTNIEFVEAGDVLY